MESKIKIAVQTIEDYINANLAGRSAYNYGRATPENGWAIKLGALELTDGSLEWRPSVLRANVSVIFTSRESFGIEDARFSRQSDFVEEMQSFILGLGKIEGIKFYFNGTSEVELINYNDTNVLYSMSVNYYVEI